MTNIKANTKEAAGYLKEEAGEALENKRMAQEGRELRNEGRAEKGELPKTGTPGDEDNKEKTPRVL